MFSEDEIFDMEDEVPIDFDGLIEAVESAAWDEFDMSSAVADYYDCRSLWDDIQSIGVEGVEDKVWEDERERIYRDAREAMLDCRGDGTFEVNGYAYRRMSRWEVAF